MGASAQRPTSGAPSAGGSGFYQNVLNQQKQAVANMPATPGGNGFGRENQAGLPAPLMSLQGIRFKPEDQAVNAYNKYMQARQNRNGVSPKGITMGAGYSNRPFG
tara:strand:- start:5314 stop:5628 length:315 start_codon:yes stop_codon:yes gene_type:complete